MTGADAQLANADDDGVADVAIIGGGPAGAITATLLAQAGLGVVLLERQPAWNWRAGGVFSSPVTTDALRRVGLSETTLARVAATDPRDAARDAPAARSRD